MLKFSKNEREHYFVAGSKKVRESGGRPMVAQTSNLSFLLCKEI